MSPNEPPPILRPNLNLFAILISVSSVKYNKPSMTINENQYNFDFLTPKIKLQMQGYEC